MITSVELYLASRLHYISQISAGISIVLAVAIVFSFIIYNAEDTGTFNSNKVVGRIKKRIKILIIVFCLCILLFVLTAP